MFRIIMQVVSSALFPSASVTTSESEPSNVDPLLPERLLQEPDDEMESHRLSRSDCCNDCNLPVATGGAHTPGGLLASIGGIIGIIKLARNNAFS